MFPPKKYTYVAVGEASDFDAGRPSLYFAAVNAEFNWWLLIVGLVVGAGLVWFVVLDSRRREVDIDDAERPREAAWLSAVLADEGYDVAAEAAERLLELHQRYLSAPPPDDLAPTDDTVNDTEWAIDSELPDEDRVGVERGAPDLRQ